jgi:hypothetical protein
VSLEITSATNDVLVTPAALGVLPGVLRERHDVGREPVEMTGVVDADV